MRYSIILLFVAATFLKPADPITLKQIGEKNLLYSVRGLEYYGGNLYTLDYNLSLNKINLETGEMNRVGNVTYKNARFFFSLNGKLYIIETDGSMDEINIETGEWKTISNMNVWSRTEMAFVVRNSLYTIENGALYYHRGPVYDARDQRGGSEFYNPGLLVRGQATLHSIQGEGSLYEINLSDGSWKRIGKGKAWKGVKSAAVIGDKLYTVDQAGNFSETLLADGTKTTLDETQFANTRALFAEKGKLYVILSTGSLYEVQIPAVK
jgi:hypothetical protein